MHIEMNIQVNIQVAIRIAERKVLARVWIVANAIQTQPKRDARGLLAIMPTGTREWYEFLAERTGFTPSRSVMRSGCDPKSLPCIVDRFHLNNLDLE